MIKLKMNHLTTLTLTSVVGKETVMDKIDVIVTAFDDKTVTYIDPEAVGTCVVPLEEVVKAIVRNVVDISKLKIVKPKSEPAVVESKRSAPVRRTDGGPSKKDRAIALLKANPGLEKQQYIEMFMTQLEMSAAGAYTYWNTYKNA